MLVFWFWDLWMALLFIKGRILNMKKVSLSFVNKVKVKNQVDWGKTYNMVVFKKK